jgi:hypothetical protein
MLDNLLRVLILGWLCCACGSPRIDARDAAVPETATPPTAAEDAGLPMPPVTEQHHIVARECPVTRLPVELPLVPGWVCSLDSTDRGRRNCAPGIECTQQEDCSDKPFGRCIGSSRHSCDYGVSEESCSADSDCVVVPGGHCLQPDPTAAESCYPDGSCVSAHAYCHYEKLSANCDQDSDCDSLPGGRCAMEITHSSCQYNNTCEVDSDCGQGKRCGCTDGDMFCVLAECSSDADCASGQQCKATPTCVGIGEAGFYCTTADDLCRDDSSCDGGFCAYDGSTAHWACTIERCNVP